MPSLDKKLICVTGLPRSGSTLLCQLLGIHPEIYSPRHSSPLCHIVTGLRHHLSDNEFLLAQLDAEFESAYRRLANLYKGMVTGWFEDTDQAWVVDKNRAWLSQIDLLEQLVPDWRMLVCVRELGQIYGSIEARHQETIFLDFPDHLANMSRYSRADKLFAGEGVIGGPLKSIESVQDVDEQLQKHLYYVIFEHLVQDPLNAMAGIYEWLGLPTASFDPQALPTKPHESDSYYRFKYPHRTRNAICPPTRYTNPPRIELELKRKFTWYYGIFYPGIALPR